jgi:hypothetical protein
MLKIWLNYVLFIPFDDGDEVLDVLASQIFDPVYTVLTETF